MSLTDDLDGSDADETIMFALDGGSYEIDLNAKNAAALARHSTSTSPPPAAPTAPPVPAAAAPPPGG